jgi:4-amino-4-deoxy-L-arabinose transferase-like glycosyltransferase
MKAVWYAAIVLLIAAAMFRVAATHRVFSQTSDEPVHIAAGLRYIQFGDCAFDIEHPPLARVLAAFPFALAPISPPPGGWIAEGNAILNWRGDYLGNLARARSGNLLFLAIAMIVVALWTRRAFGDAAAICATAMMAVLPPILGNAGLATTDMAVAAMLPAALYATSRWMDEPSWPRAIVAGIVIGLGLLTKYSFLVFFPLGVLVLFGVRRKRPTANGAAALLIALLVVWAAYFFDFESPRRALPQGAEMAFHAYQGPLSVLVPESVADVPMAAPLYALGILEVKFHNERGHEAFLLGRYSRYGWWYYFPVVLFFKTPIAFLILAAYGAAIAWRRARELALLPLAVLLPAMASTIDIGVRHILPIYPLLAILAGAALVAIWSRWRVVAAVLAAWLLVVTTLAHPDYFAWFNEAAGRHPEQIVVDSNLDWGQDVLRLAAVCRARHVDRIGLALFSTADFDRIGLPPHTIVTPAALPHGWLAVSELFFRLQPYRSLDRMPYERVGKSIRLYRLP